MLYLCIMEIADKNILNFGRGIWTYGKLILVDDNGKDVFCVISRNEKINVGDVYVMQLRRHSYDLMNPCIDQAEADRCNANDSIGRCCHKLLVAPEQIVEDELVLLKNIGSHVLIKCYPLMDGPGQAGWMIDNDVEGGTNKVIIHFEYE